MNHPSPPGRALALVAAVCLGACLDGEPDRPDQRTAARPWLDDDAEDGRETLGEEPGPAVEITCTGAGCEPEEMPLDLTATSRIAGPIGDDDGVIAGCTGNVAGASVLCVDGSAAPGGNGTAAAPFQRIGDAVAVAVAGDSVQIAQGTYVENVHLGGTRDIGNGRAVSFRGGFRAGDFSIRNARIHPTIVDGNLTAPVFQVYLSAGSMTIDGLTITRGRGLVESQFVRGGGIYLQNFGSGTATISHSEIHANRAMNGLSAERRYGGGIHAWNQGSGRLVLEHNHIHDNAAGKGAALHIIGSSATLARNLIENNVGHWDHGGAVYLGGVGAATVERNVIRGNAIGRTANYGWGGGAVFVGGSTVTESNIFTDNFAPGSGSAIFFDDGAVAVMKNDFIYRNRCTNNGRSALYVDGYDETGSHVTVENATIVGHPCQSWQTDGVIHLERHSTVTVRSSILWNNRIDVSTDGTGSSSWSHSITASTAGTGNLVGVDPLFADLAANDFHLRSLAGRWNGAAWVSDATTSPALDRGDPATPVGAEPIPHGGRVEMGAHGGTEEASKSPGSEACDAPAYTLAPGDTVELVGTTTGSADDLHTCWDPSPAFDGGEVVYRLALTQPGGTLQVVLDEPGGLEASLVVHDGACGSDASQYCWSFFSDEEVALLEPSTTSVYVVVDGRGASSGAYALTVSYDLPACGDGQVNTGEACDGGGPALGCTGQCTFAPPDPAAEACGPGVPRFDVPAGGRVISTGTLLTTNGYADDALGSCAGSTGGSDQVLELVPGATGTMRVRIGHDATGPVWQQGLDDPRVWDEVLHARASCAPESELACADDLFASEDLRVPVVAGVPFYLFVDGYDAGSYSRGPYELRIDYLP